MGILWDCPKSDGFSFLDNENSLIPLDGEQGPLTVDFAFGVALDVGLCCLP